MERKGRATIQYCKPVGRAFRTSTNTLHSRLHFTPGRISARERYPAPALHVAGLPGKGKGPPSGPPRRQNCPAWLCHQGCAQGGRGVSGRSGAGHASVSLPRRVGVRDGVGDTVIAAHGSCPSARPSGSVSARRRRPCRESTDPARPILRRGWTRSRHWPQSIIRQGSRGGTPDGCDSSKCYQKGRTVLVKGLGRGPGVQRRAPRPSPPPPLVKRGDPRTRPFLPG